MIKPFRIIKNIDSVVLDRKKTLGVCRFDAFDRRVIMENYAPVELDAELVKRALNTIESFFGKEKYEKNHVTMLVPKNSTDQVLFIVEEFYYVKRKGGIPRSETFVITIAPRKSRFENKASLLEKDDVEQWT